MLSHFSRRTLATLTLCFVAAASAQVITTVAGVTGTLRGAGGPATAAHLGRVHAVTVDSANNVYAIDAHNSAVVKISPSGVLTVVAGNTIAGFSGDGGPAVNASLEFDTNELEVQLPGLAVDSNGNIYISDALNDRVRRVSPNGTITTLANIFSPGPLAVSTTGNVYVSDFYGAVVRRISPTGTVTVVAGRGVEGFSGDGGPATSARLDGPSGLALDSSGNLYIADSFNGRVRRVSTSGTITTIAGGSFSLGDGGPATLAELQHPAGLAFDAAGNLYIADMYGDRIRKVTPGGTISTVAGSGVTGFAGDGGPATSAQISNAGSVAVDSVGNLYIGDTENFRIRRVTGGIMNTIGGNGSFRFFGDGGPATSAEVNQPQDVAVDSAGNIYVADTENARIRKITPEGVITTYAGNGVDGASGDGGPATSAIAGKMENVAVDRLGNVYFSTGNIYSVSRSLVRKVTPNGIISTVAGFGNERGFSGDGGPATQARLDWPKGLAVDAAGNVYIADFINNRVRRVAPNGIITTVAGNGTQGTAGDGGPAISAQLNLPRDVAVDGSGNLYIAGPAVDRVRKVTPAGIITTLALVTSPRGLSADAAGNVYTTSRDKILKISPSGAVSTVAGNTEGFSGDGGPATNALLKAPFGTAVDTAGNLYIADTENDRIRKVLVAAPSFLLTPSTLSVTAPAGTAAVTRQIAVSSAVGGLSWTPSASTQSGGSWLSVSPASGNTPGAITVSVNLLNLTPGTYRGTITVQSPQAAPSTQSATIELTVTEAPAPQLLVDVTALTFESALAAPTTAPQALRISNAGGGALNWTARAATTSGGDWLRISSAAGSASAGAPAAIQVSAIPTGLAAGVYSGTVTVESSTTNERRTVAVTLLVLQTSPTILVSQSGLLFTGVEGAAAVPAQNFGIINAGQGSMSWTARAETLSGGSWLTVSPASGRSEANSLEVPLVDVGINLTGLRAGQYSGLIRVEALGSNNSPQLLTVDLTVLPRGSIPEVLVRPTGLIFATQAGSSSPGSQTVRLGAAAAAAVEMRSGVLTFDGGSWLQTVPRNMVLASAAPGTLTVQPTLGSLATGVYRAALTLLFGDGSPTQTVNILLLVVPQATSANGHGAEAPCAPQRLYAVQRALGNNFSATVSRPSAVEIQVMDDCGTPVPNATVVATFANGDPPLALSSLRNGLYVATWRPVNPATQMTVTVRAALSPLAPVELQLQGQVRDNATAPALAAGGIVNGASFAPGAAIAPGSVISVFGRNLATGLNHASQLPLEKTLGGATLNIGGIDAPLFFSSAGQINAQLPFELPANSRLPAIVKVRRDGTGPESLTVPETFTISPAQPGIFTTNQQGTGQGAILNEQGRLVDATAPTEAGRIIQVFCTGLGATQPAVVSGRPAPADTLALVSSTVAATIDGKPAVIHFAGLAPGFVGLYQVNVQIPEGVAPSPAVPLVLSQNGVPSNTVTLAVR